ncbi:hypothetical protein RB195_004150 [Necator americanus]|uniref:Uncharacterized protein n=1 Tax=Necator americanus TaxID=51031 RepID=A0ABR1BGK9_NECAM
MLFCFFLKDLRFSKRSLFFYAMFTCLIATCCSGLIKADLEAYVDLSPVYIGDSMVALFDEKLLSLQGRITYDPLPFFEIGFDVLCFVSVLCRRYGGCWQQKEKEPVMSKCLFRKPIVRRNNRLFSMHQIITDGAPKNDVNCGQHTITSPIESTPLTSSTSVYRSSCFSNCCQRVQRCYG